MKNKSLIISLMIIFLILLSSLILIYYLLFLPCFSSRNSEDCNIYLHAQPTIADVQEQLSLCGDLKSTMFMKVYVNLRGYSHKFKPGYYTIPSNISTFHLIRKLISGAQTPVKITFNNIRFKEQLAQRLASQLQTDSVSILSMLNDSTLMQTYGFNTENFISMFIPNTYEVYWTITPEQLAKRMNREYNNYWNAERLQKAQQIG